jgi:uroporphyrinogen decarboxylase
MLTIDHVRDPNFDLLRRALLRQGELERVPFLELFADREIIASVMGVPAAAPADEIEAERWTRLKVEFWHKLGYDAIWLGAGPDLETKTVFAADTADLARDQRSWYAAELGILTTWKEFERYPWPSSADADYSQVELAASILPPGMKILGSVMGALEPIMWLMGYSSFALALYDDPDLVQAIFDKLDAIYTPVAESLLDMDAVGGLFVGDDMGFKTATMIAPEHLRQYVFPYHKKLARMAHDRGKVYVLHACGNLATVMDDLIDDVQIDAKHSYEDVIMPVEQVKATYGDRIGIVGGIDLDLLCRAPEDAVRQRVRYVLDANMPGGGYVLGTGNSVANYVPVRNFIAMVEEGHAWHT